MARELKKNYIKGRFIICTFHQIEEDGMSVAWEIRYGYEILVGKPDMKTPVVKPGHKDG
jgi:hypothetical protein